MSGSEKLLNSTWKQIWGMCPNMILERDRIVSHFDWVKCNLLLINPLLLRKRQKKSKIFEWLTLAYKVNIYVHKIITTKKYDSIIRLITIMIN